MLQKLWIERVFLHCVVEALIKQIGSFFKNIFRLEPDKKHSFHSVEYESLKNYIHSAEEWRTVIRGQRKNPSHSFHSKKKEKQPNRKNKKTLNTLPPVHLWGAGLIFKNLNSFALATTDIYSPLHKNNFLSNSSLPEGCFCIASCCLCWEFPTNQMVYLYITIQKYQIKFWK